MKNIKQPSISKKMVIAGGSGFLGAILSNYFATKGYKVVVLTRQHRIDTNQIHYVQWNAKDTGPWIHALEGASVIINLNGKSVDCRYNEQNKQLIYSTRIDATYALQKAVEDMHHPPKVWINASSATIYRHAEDRDMDENTGDLGDGFSVDVCRKWEQAFFERDTPNTRKVALRIAIVLGREGGALQPLMQLTKWGLGGRQGTGKQYFSWIHETDFVRLVEFVINNDTIEGVYNAAAPHPIPNRQVMAAIRKALHRPVGLPMPKWLLAIGAKVIHTETELILKSRRVVPTKLREAGFVFQYHDVQPALQTLLHPS